MKYIHSYQFFIFAVVAMLSTAFTNIAHAACTTPTGEEGNLTYNNDENVLQLCDGTNWQALGPVGVTTGAGCANPTGVRGELMYNDDYNVPQYCNSNDWISLGPINPYEVKFTPTDNAAGDKFTVTDIAGNLLVGASFADDTRKGSAYLFDISDPSNLTELSKITTSDRANEDNSGASNIYGNKLLYRSYLDDNGNGTDAGSAYIFDITDPTNPVQKSKIIASDGEDNDQFGWGFAIYGDIAAVGAPAGDKGAIINQDTGAVYIYDISNPASPVELSKITASDAATDDSFGFALDIREDILFVGATADDDNGADSGSAYAFDISDPSNPAQLSKFTASDGVAGDCFGSGVAIANNAVAIAAICFNSSQGAVYVFDISNPANPVQRSKITASDGATGDTFGFPVTSNGKNILSIAAGYNNDSYSQSGSHYLFDISDPVNPVELKKINASDPHAQARFGAGMMAGDKVVVGSYWNDINGKQSGAAYIYDLNLLLGDGTCSNPADVEGAIIYSSSAGALQYCDGARWRMAGPPKTPVYRSCKEIKDNGASTGNGVYTITPQPGGDDASIDVYCDMTTDGGGWTMVVAQYEADQLANWNEGTQGDYDPTLASNKSFTLSADEMPPHSQTAFGKDLDPTFIDYVNFEYTNFNIGKTFVSSPKTGSNYHIARYKNHNHSSHDPDDTVGVGGTHKESLTFDLTPGRGNDWAFVPHHTTAAQRGYSMNGSYTNGTSESYAWTVWVR